MSETRADAPFDGYACDYQAVLDQGIRLSGEDSGYFARSRTEWLAKRLMELDAPSRQILDFGCGTGIATPYLLQLPGVESIVGVDVSLDSLEIAEREHASEQVTFKPVE